MTQPHQPPAPERAGVGRCQEIVDIPDGHRPPMFIRKQCQRGGLYNGYCWQHRKKEPPTDGD